jgi:hypothetical protein
MFRLPAKVMPELEVARGSGAGTSCPGCASSSSLPQIEKEGALGYHVQKRTIEDRMRPEYQIEERRIIIFAHANVNGHRKWIMNANDGSERVSEVSDQMYSEPPDHRPLLPPYYNRELS